MPLPDLEAMVLRPRMRGMSDIPFCRILMFMWSVGSLTRSMDVPDTAKLFHRNLHMSLARNSKCEA